MENKSNKGLLIGLGIAVLLIIIIIIVVVSKNKKTDTSEAEATLAALQAQANNDSLPPADKQNLLGQIENISKIIYAIKNPGSTATPPIAGPGSSTGTTWSPIASSTGLCKNPAFLNKDMVLKLNSKNGEVCALQSYLNSKKNAQLVNDGIFGTKTQAALMQATGKPQIALKELIG